jgi:hypothetical protein
LEASLKVALAYRDELEWHQRLLIRKGTPATMLIETGVTAKDGERVWWVLTPDGDVCPEEIGLSDEVEAVKLGRPDGTFAAAADGRYVHAFTAERKAGPPGLTVVLAAREAADARETELSDAPTHVAARVDELAGPPVPGWTWRCCEVIDSDAKLGAVYEVGPNVLVTGANHALMAARRGGQLRVERVRDTDFDTWLAEREAAVVAYAATVTPRGEPGDSNEGLRARLRGADAAAAGEPGGAVQSEDVRTLAVDYDAQSERHKAWRDVVRESWESNYKDWPVEGPHCVLHLLKHFSRHGGTPTQWLDLWCREKRVEATDRIYYELRTLAEAFETGGTYDQLNMPSLAAFEVLGRRWSTIIDAYGVNPSKPNFESAKFFTGKGDWTDSVSPELRRHVAQRATAELEIEKSRQKTRELRHDVDKDHSGGAGRGRGGGRGSKE